jgi:hypothetical protein
VRERERERERPREPPPCHGGWDGEKATPESELRFKHPADFLIIVLLDQWASQIIDQGHMQEDNKGNLEDKIKNQQIKKENGFGELILCTQYVRPLSDRIVALTCRGSSLK